MEPQYVIARSTNAGVFAGTLHAPVTQLGDAAKLDTLVLTGARRLWYWDGAASLSELATRGTSNPGGCKFPAEVPMVHLEGVCEVLPVSEEARKTIKAAPVWSK